MVKTEDGFFMIHICPLDWESLLRPYPGSLCSRCMGRASTLTVTEEEFFQLEKILKESNTRQHAMMEKIKEIEERNDVGTTNRSGD